MKTATPAKRPTKADKAVRRLFVALEKVIQATDGAKQARDELVRLGHQQQRGQR